MATRDDIVTDVTTLLGTDPHLSTAEIQTLVQLRYSHLYDTFLWSRRLRDFTISTVAQVSSTTSDTVTVTNASATVTSAGTPFTSAMTDRQIALGDMPGYLFLTYVSTSEITLHDGEGTAVTWPGDTESGVSWRIFNTLYSLPLDADAVLSIGSDIALVEVDGGRGTLDEWDPERETTADPVTHWCYAGVTGAAGRRKIEVWPTPSAARILRGQYARSVPTLGASTVIEFNRALLVYAAAADCLGMLYAKTGDESYKETGLFYERKSRELEADIKPREQERLSLPTSIGRGPRRLGADFYVDHQDMAGEG